MQKALDFIDENLMEDISLYDISCEAGFSAPQFYRLFKRLTGDTVNSYILRRKLSLAAKDIKNSSHSISSIAYDYGFSSHDVFTRAFTRVYGVSPSKYRQEDGIVPLKRTFLEGKKQEDEYQMEFQVINHPNFEVVGLECDAKIWDQDGSIGKLWSDFLTRIDEISGPQEPMTMYGICEYEQCDNQQFKYMAGVRVSQVGNLPQGMVSRCMIAQSFLQASVPASISVPDAYTATIGYAKSLGYEIEDYDSIEVYEEWFKNPAYYSFQLLIPIK
jgi:AraC family transcriptional regulator